MRLRKENMNDRKKEGKEGRVKCGSLKYVEDMWKRKREVTVGKEEEGGERGGRWGNRVQEK